MADVLSVYVVQEPTGLWVAGCCNDRCGYEGHDVAEEKTKAAAERAAAEHRAELRREGEEQAARAAESEKGTTTYWWDVAQQRQRELARAERELEAARGAVETLARFRTFLDEDFRQWCSPNGVAARYADDLLRILDQGGSNGR
ncbi:hypothetical protein ACLQ2R_17490 [Streptosporangium sp. DT93]|uniref:hypothetical protein n=1 Tax=Streptosporangium sp. DT93 TaxID=3393428 RepID=UPI003CE8B651